MTTVIEMKEKDVSKESIPFITIGIASYNYAGFLKKAFEQIRKQSFRDFELLYCDDGSKDDSVQVIEGFIRDNPDMDIRLVRGENKGILYNKNRIIDNARGRYIMICDADDYMETDCLEKLCKMAMREKADCVIGGFREVSLSGKVLKEHIPNENSCKWIFTWHHAHIYRRDILEKNHIRFRELPDDVEYLQQIHRFSPKTVFVSQVLYNWVRHEDSSSSDTQVNPDWNPVIIWGKVARQIGRLRESIDSQEKKYLDYFLYKWFYLNVTDIRGGSLSDIRRDLAKMKKNFIKVQPYYRNLRTLFKAYRTNDTVFAKAAIGFCFVLDKLHLAWLLPVFRILQQRYRRKNG